MHAGRDVAQAELSAHGDPTDAERELGRQFSELGLGAGSSGRSVGDQTHSMSARNLTPREVQHVAEKPADRRT
jgi:hypothetical protein